MALRGIIFDMDGTLGDTMPIVVHALQETLRHYAGREYAEAEIYTMFGPTEEGVIQPRVPEASYPAAVQMYLDQYAALHQSTREPFPDVISLLERLQARGIHRGVVTGKGKNSAEISMRAMGLAPFIEVLVSGSSTGAEKPVAIRQVLAEWGISPAEAAYVGDMPYDMRAAVEAGVLPLGAGWAKSATVRSGNGARVFASVRELMEFLEL